MDKPVGYDDQKHLRCTKEGPFSWYYCLVMNIGKKLLKEARMDPPIQDENFRSGGSKTLIFIVEGASAITSFCNRSLRFFSMLVPPAITIFPYRSFLMSESHFRIDWNVNSWAPSNYLPTIFDGWKSASGHLNAWLSKSTHNYLSRYRSHQAICG